MQKQLYLIYRVRANFTVGYAQSIDFIVEYKNKST